VTLPTIGKFQPIFNIDIGNKGLIVDYSARLMFAQNKFLPTEKSIGRKISEIKNFTP